MRTTLNLDEKLLNELLCATSERDKGKAVNLAISEYLRRRKIESLLAARGMFPDWEDNTKKWRETDMLLETEERKQQGW